MPTRLFSNDAFKLFLHMQKEPVIFQDFLDAGYSLAETEAASDYLSNIGKLPVTAMRLIDMKKDESYGELFEATVVHTVERLESTLHDDVLGLGNWNLRKI